MPAHQVIGRQCKNCGADDWRIYGNGRAHCGPCTLAHQRRVYADPARKAYMREYFKGYLPRYRMQPEVRERERAKAREHHKSHARFTKHGMTMDEYHAMFEKQGELCLICKAVLIRPYVDHDHITKHIRGLLCQHCNTGLGYFRDDPAILRAAAGYLER